MRRFDAGPFSYQKTRPSHPKADPAAQARLKNLSGKLREVARDNAQGGQVELWFQDEAAVG